MQCKGAPHCPANASSTGRHELSGLPHAENILLLRQAVWHSPDAVTTLRNLRHADIGVVSTPPRPGN